MRSTRTEGRRKHSLPPGLFALISGQATAESVEIWWRAEVAASMVTVWPCDLPAAEANEGGHRATGRATPGCYGELEPIECGRRAPFRWPEDCMTRGGAGHIRGAPATLVALWIFAAWVQVITTLRHLANRQWRQSILQAHQPHVIDDHGIIRVQAECPHSRYLEVRLNAVNVREVCAKATEPSLTAPFDNLEDKVCQLVLGLHRSWIVITELPFVRNPGVAFDPWSRSCSGRAQAPCSRNRAGRRQGWWR